MFCVHFLENDLQLFYPTLEQLLTAGRWRRVHEWWPEGEIRVLDVGPGGVRAITRLIEPQPFGSDLRDAREHHPDVEYVSERLTWDYLLAMPAAHLCVRWTRAYRDRLLENTYAQLSSLLRLIEIDIGLEESYRSSAAAAVIRAMHVDARLVLDMARKAEWRVIHYAERAAALGWAGEGGARGSAI